MSETRTIILPESSFVTPLSSDEVKFLVIHYTGGSWSRVKDIFENPEKFGGVWAHFVIDTDGYTADLANTLSGSTFVGAHAGLSFLLRNDELISQFNRHSIGIEVVNVNGNLIPFEDAQYAALKNLVSRLKKLYPHISNLDAVVGHDEIAGYRGKIDPGILFDWERFFKDCYSEFKITLSRPNTRINKTILTIFKEALLFEPNQIDKIDYDHYWHEMNYLMETVTILLNNGVPKIEVTGFLKKSLHKLNNIL